MLTRRSLFLASLPLLGSRPVLANTGTSERWLWAINRAGEEVAVVYRNQNGYNHVALARFAHLFRDLREDVAGPMPPLLVDLLSVLQERWGYRQPLIIGSGYRTPRTNASLEGAAPASMHLRGFAADITMRGVHPGPNRGHGLVAVPANRLHGPRALFGFPACRHRSATVLDSVEVVVSAAEERSSQPGCRSVCTVGDGSYLPQYGEPWQPARAQKVLVQGARTTGRSPNPRGHIL